MERVKVRIEGTRPLLMHRVPIDFGERTRGKTNPQDEADRALYRDQDGTIGIPGINIISSIRRAATDYKVPGKGRRSFRDYIFSGVQIEPEFIALSVSDGANPEKAWELDLRPVVVQRARIIRARPRFNDWALEFTLVILDPIVRAENLKEMLESAGQYVGLCDARPLFGLFRVASFEKLS